MSLVSFIDNPQDEVKRIEKEQEEKIKHSDSLMYNEQDSDNEPNNSSQSDEE